MSLQEKEKVAVGAVRDLLIECLLQERWCQAVTVGKALRFLVEEEQRNRFTETFASTLVGRPTPHSGTSEYNNTF